MKYQKMITLKNGKQCLLRHGVESDGAKALENFNLREIMQLLDKLCDLDYRFKVDSQIDEKLKLELFLMELL